jgi:Domain of unknown function DUF83
MNADPKELSCARYRVVFEARETLDLPAYLGSTLRGAFGHAFRAVACPAPRGLDCPAPAQCPYHLIFETSPPPGSESLRTHDDIPRPFVIAPTDLQQAGDDEQVRRAFQRGDEVSFELVLIGRAQEFVPSRQLVTVPVGAQEREEVTRAIAEMRRVIEQENIPGPTSVRARCVACEFRNYCADIW